MAIHLSRRELLGRTVALTAGALGARQFLAESLARAADEMPRIHLGLITYMVGANMDVPTLIDVCEKTGFEGLELRTTHKHGVEPTLDADGRAKVKALFAKTKVRLYSFGTACEFHSTKPEEVKKNIELTKEFVKLAADLGAWGVKVRPNGLPKDVPAEKTLRQIGESVAECAEFAKGKGVVIVVEMHGKDTQEPSNMAKIMEFCKHPNAGLTWNSNPIDAKNGSIKANFDLCKQWIRHCHCRQFTPSSDNYPWKELMTLLKGINYGGYTMLESTSKEEPIAYLKAQKAAWEELQK